MVKFVDKNRKGEYYKDELLVRCKCACGILSFRTLDIEVEGTGNTLPTLELFPYMNGTNGYAGWRKVNAASELYFSPDAIKTIYGLMNGEINNGIGYVEDQNGLFIGIHSEKDDNNKNTISIYSVASERDIRKIHKGNIKNIEKTVIWDVTFESAESEKIIAFIGQFIEKKVDPAIANLDQIVDKVKDEISKK